MYRILLVWTFAVAIGVWPCTAKSGPVPQRYATVYAITKNVIAILADPRREVALSREKILLSAGTRVLIYPNITNSKGILFLSDLGIWGFIDKTSFWTNLAPQDFGFQNRAVAITRPTIVDLGDGLTMPLSPSTTWELVDEGGVYFTIRITGDRHPALRNDFIKDAKLERTHGNIVESEPLSKEDIDFFTQGILDDVYELRKECRKENVAEMQVEGSGGLGIDWSIFKFGASITEERTSIEKYESYEVVLKQYFLRKKSKARYTLTQIKNCEGEQQGEIKYIFWNENRGISHTINRKFATDYGLNFDRRSGQLLVTCYQDYDDAISALINEQFEDSEAHFLISRITKWDTGENLSSCSDRPSIYPPTN